MSRHHERAVVGHGSGAHPGRNPTASPSSRRAFRKPLGEDDPSGRLDERQVAPAALSPRPSDSPLPTSRGRAGDRRTRPKPSMVASPRAHPSSERRASETAAHATADREERRSTGARRCHHRASGSACVRRCRGRCRRQLTAFSAACERRRWIRRIGISSCAADRTCLSDPVGYLVGGLADVLVVVVDLQVRVPLVERLPAERADDLQLPALGGVRGLGDIEVELVRHPDGVMQALGVVLDEPSAEPTDLRVLRLGLRELPPAISKRSPWIELVRYCLSRPERVAARAPTAKTRSSAAAVARE